MVFTVDKNKVNYGGVYEIESLTNGKKYVGSSIDIKRRWGNHKSMLRRGCHSNPHLQSAWDKYGKKYFMFRVLVYTEPEEGLRLEGLLLAANNHEYNIGLVATSAMLGRHHSRASRKKISKALKGRAKPPRTEEHRRNIGKAEMGEKHYLYGKHRTEEFRRKLSQANIGSNHPQWISLSEDELEEMKTLREQGYYYKEIGEVLGITEGTARRRLQGISYSRYTK